jgi:3-phenylpropionate/trans-cinnamate dioxygenase ferredoxin subunit
MKLVGTVPLASLEGGALVRLEYPPRHVLVALVDGTPFAIEDACNHAGASLAKGPREGCVVACPLHAYRFDLRTGELLSPRRACAPQRRFETALAEESVQVFDPFELSVTRSGPLPTTEG